MASNKTAAITIARKSGAAALMKRISGMANVQAYVGIPAATSKNRSRQLLSMASATKGRRKRGRLEKAATSDVNNAELLFVFSKGSPLRSQPPRPVLEPAVKADGKIIARELGASVKAHLDGDHDMALKYAKRAALAGQNAARKWFTDPRNGWADLADSTKEARFRKMSPTQRKTAKDEKGELLKSAYTIGVDTGAMRAAIIGFVEEV